jgi:hypothetical protein
MYLEIGFRQSVSGPGDQIMATISVLNSQA